MQIEDETFYWDFSRLLDQEVIQKHQMLNILQFFKADTRGLTTKYYGRSQEVSSYGLRKF